MSAISITSNPVVDACGSWPWWGDVAQSFVLLVTLVITLDLCLHLWRAGRTHR